MAVGGVTPRAQARAAGKKLRVLVVDDDDWVRRVVTRMLTVSGYDVVDTIDPVAALTLASEGQSFDLAVLDVAMPGMTGDELASRLRQRDPDLKVLYLTGRSDQLFAAKPTLWENEAFVEKPISLQGLREAVSLLLFGQIRVR